MRRWRRVLAIGIVGASMAAVGCSGHDKGPITISHLRLEPNPSNVLSAELRFDTDRAARATLHIKGPTAALAPMTEQSPDTGHRLAVVGLRALTSYEVWVTVRGRSGAATTSEHLPFTTGALPDDLPPITVSSDPTRMATGVTLFDSTRRVEPPAPTDGRPPPFLGYLEAVDDEGQVVWYHRAPSPIGDARLLANGHILYEYNNMGAREIDLLGHVVREWAGKLELGRLAVDRYGRTVAGPDAIALDFDSIHHEITPLPNGNFLTLSNELRTINGFDAPQCGEDPASFDGSYLVIADVVIEFRPETGAVVHRWPLADYLHPQTDPADANICGFPDPDIYPNFLYSALGPVHDWTHANAAVYDADRDLILISIRHLNAVLALRYHADDDGPAGSVAWRLGPGGDFALAGGDWAYHQHAVEVEDDGSILLYDNGNERPGTDAHDPAHLPVSRTVRYSLQDRGPRSTWTATQTWQYRSDLDGSPVYAFFVGDADLLDNGNVLIDNGGISEPASGNAQIVEVDPDPGPDGGDVVFDLRITGPGTTWFVYRAERLPSLYGPAATAP